MSGIPDQLPETFTYGEARRRGLSNRQIYRMRDAGLIERVAHGLYRRADRDPPPDLDLIELAHGAFPATVCLTSALVRHGLADDIPASVDVALPRGQYQPRTVVPVTWHQFDPDTFDIGREEAMLAPGCFIGIYSPERSIIDAIRLRHWEGAELGYTALRRWLRWQRSSPSDLVVMARRLPHAEHAVRSALEILL